MHTSCNASSSHATAPKDDPHWGHYDRLRQLYESLGESVPQAGLQILLVWRGIDRESEVVLYTSVAIAILNAVRNLYKVYAGAQESGAYLYDFIYETLSLGVGHVPHIAAIRSGKGSTFDFSKVEPALLMG